MVKSDDEDSKVPKTEEPVASNGADAPANDEVRSFQCNSPSPPTSP
jgi:hypothetical protein